MARFVWRLQRVLDVKQKQEQAKRMELLQITGQVTRTQTQLILRQQALQAMLETVAQEPRQERMSKQALAMDYAKGSQVRMKALEEQIETLQAQKKETTEELLALKQTTEGLERLRAGAEHLFLEDLNKKEQKMADELTLMKYVRNTPPCDSLEGLGIDS